MRVISRFDGPALEDPAPDLKGEDIQGAGEDPALSPLPWPVSLHPLVQAELAIYGVVFGAQERGLRSTLM